MGIKIQNISVIDFKSLYDCKKVAFFLLNISEIEKNLEEKKNLLDWISWDVKKICDWIAKIENGKFAKYEKKYVFFSYNPYSKNWFFFCFRFESHDIDGKKLRDVTPLVLEMIGISGSDVDSLFKHIQSLKSMTVDSSTTTTGSLDSKEKNSTKNQPKQNGDDEEKGLYV